MLRPVRTVRVTTKEELDAALPTADQITIEGDDELLTYAVNKAVKDDPETRVAIEVQGRHRNGVAFGEELHAVAATSRRRAISSVTLAATSLLLFMAVVGGIWSWPEQEQQKEAAGQAERQAAQQKAAQQPAREEAARRAAEQEAAQQQRQQQTQDDAAAREEAARRAAEQEAAARRAAEQEATRRQQAAAFWASFSSLLWPLVAIVAIIALFLIAWKAISSGSNVTIQWKVTEKVTGRVVITKIRERAPSKQAA